MKKLLSILFLSITLSSCAFKLVPSKDNEILLQVETIAKNSDKLFLNILESENNERAYSKFKYNYIDIEVELNDLIRKENRREKGEELVRITTNILEQFVKYKERHKTEDLKIKDAVIVLQRQYLSDHFNTLIITEKSLP